MKSCIKLAALVLGLASAATVSASTVTFSLVIDPSDSSFDLFATSSAGDNDGIAAYGVPLLGSILTLNHNSPNGLSSPTAAGVGFTLLRSADGVTTVAGSQDTITPTGFIVYGLGQTAGDLMTISPAFFIVEQQVYGSPLLLAEGTYGATMPSFNLASVDLGANTFDDMNGANPIAVSAATISTNVTVIPEPATTGLLALGSFLLLWRRKVRAS